MKKRIMAGVLLLILATAGIAYAASNDGSWSWSMQGVTLEAIAWNEPGGGVTVSLYAENDRDYDIRFEKFSWTVYIGGRSYQNNISVRSVEAGDREWLGDVYAEWKGREKVSSVTIPGNIRVERID